MYKKLLKNPNFLLLWLTQMCAILGSELFNIGVLVTVFQQTGSTLQTAGAMVARALPAFLLGPFAGVLVDRYPRKWVMVAMNLIRAVLTIATPILILQSNDVSVVGAYTLVVVLAAAQTFHIPARLAVVPSIVDKESLVHANSFLLASNQAFAALSFAVGGALVLQVGLSGIIALVAGCFILASILPPFIQIAEREGELELPKRTSMYRAFGDGLRYLRRHPVARPLTIMEAFEHIPHGIWTSALMLAFTTQALQATPKEWGWQVTSYFSGMMVGSVVSLFFAGILSRKAGWVIIINATLSGVLTLAYASSPTVFFAVVLAFLFGPPFAIRDVAQDSLLQGTVDDEMLGRVYATREMIRNVIFMVAGLFFAWLSDQMDIRTIYYMGGGLYVLTAIYAWNSAGIRQSNLEAKETVLT